MALLWGGLPDLIKPEETGLLVQVADADDLAQKILRLLNSPQDRVIMGINARKYIEESHGVEVEAARYHSLFNRILKNHPMLTH